MDLISKEIFLGKHNSVLHTISYAKTKANRTLSKCQRILYLYTTDSLYLRSFIEIIIYIHNLI